MTAAPVPCSGTGPRRGEDRSPFLLRCQSRASRLGSDAPSPARARPFAQTDPRRRFASGSPHARLRLDARLLRPVAVHPRLAIPRMASLARSRRYAASRPPVAIRSPAMPWASRVTARRYAPRSFALPRCRDLPTPRPAVSHRRRTLAALPQPHHATATARRPADGVAGPRSSLRDLTLAGLVIHDEQQRPCAIAFIPAEIPLVLVERFALSRSTRLASRSAHRGLDANPASPALRPLLEHALSQPASPAYQAQARHRELRRIAPLHLRLKGRLIDRPRHHDRSSDKKKPDRNRPDLRIAQPGPLLSPPVHIVSIRHDAPTYSACHEDRAMQAACAPGTAEMKKQRCTPVQAGACGSVVVLL